MPTVASGDAEIFYEVSGEGDPLLLIMGLGADARGWALQIPAFAKRHRVISFDNRGVGRSSTPSGPYSTAGMAADALAVLDAAGVARAHVLGVSMGGAIAQHVALSAPGRVRSLVLGSTWAGPSEWRSRVRVMQLALAGMGREELVRARLLFLFTPRLFEAAPKVIDLIEKSLTGDGNAQIEGYLHQLDAAEEHDLRDRLGEVRAPTLVLTGRRDILVPPELSEEVAGLIPGAELVVLESAHAVQFEEAETFNRTILGFLARH